MTESSGTDLMATDSPFAARHPAAWGLAAGGLFSLAGLALFDAQLWVLLVGAVFGFAHWFIWRRGGPAHEWRRRLLLRFPPRA